MSSLIDFMVRAIIGVFTVVGLFTIRFAHAQYFTFTTSTSATYTLTGIRAGDAVPLHITVVTSDPNDPSENESVTVNYPGGFLVLGVTYPAASTGDATFQAASDNPTISIVSPGDDENITIDAGIDVKSLGPVCEVQCAGDPINTGNGNAYQAEADYVGGGPFPLHFERYYNSVDAGGVGIRPAGVQWTHTYDRRIIRDTNGDLIAYRATGRGLTFKPQTTGGYDSDADVTETLTDISGGGWRLRNDEDGDETYNTNGQLTSLTDRTGFVQVLAYDANYRLVRVTDPFGRALTFSYNASGQIASLTVPGGGMYQYSYDANDNLDHVVYPDNSTRQYLYEDANHLHSMTGLIDENGVRYASWVYGPLGATFSELANGVNRTTVDYGNSGIATVTDVNGVVQTNSFLFAQRIRRIVSNTFQCPTCNGMRRTYDYYTTSSGANSGLLKRTTDFNGNVTGYSFLINPWKFPTQISSGGNTIAINWSDSFRLPEYVDIYGPGGVTSGPSTSQLFSYDARGRLLLSYFYDPVYGGVAYKTMTYTYFPDGVDMNGNPLPGQLASVDGPRTDVSDITGYTYDSQGNLATITNALGKVTKVTLYDASGRPQTLIDQNNMETNLTYDARGRLRSKTVSGAKTTYNYDPAGNLTGIVKPNGVALSYGYDDAHRLVSVADNLGDSIQYTLDAAGNRTQVQIKDPAGTLRYTRTQTFNELSRLTNISGLNGNQSFAYDNVGNLISFTDGSGNATAYAYDALNRLSMITDAGGGQTIFTNNAIDRLDSVQDPNGHQTTYTYVYHVGYLNKEVSPDTGTTYYGHDQAGNISSLKNANGSSINFTYDALNRLTSIGNPGITYNYDERGASYGYGRLTSMIDSAGTTSFSYTASGQMASASYVNGKTTYKVQYSYNSADQVTSITYPSGRVISYSRDNNGRISGVTSTYNRVTQTLASNVAYTPFGPLTQLTYGNGLLLTRTVDSNYRISGYSVGAVSGFSYGFYGADDIASATPLSGPAQSFSYDALRRLTGASGSYGNLSWLYDANGNRTSETSGATSTSYTMNTANDWLMSLTSGSSSTAFGYDAAGNTTAKGGLSFSYDALNRVIQIKNGSTTLGTYVYNGINQRVKKTVGSATTIYLYDQGGHLIEEVGSTGATVEYVYLEDLPLAAIYTSGKTATTYYIHPDYQGIPQAVTGSSGAVAWAASYSPFGQAAISTGTITFNLRFPGQYYDAESGLHYNWNRYYDPQTGRYLSSDPIGLAGGMNPYSYVYNSPLSYIDPLGLTAEDIARLTALARQTQPDLNVPQHIYTMSMSDGGLGFTNPVTKNISVNNKFLEPLDDSGRKELLDTIIHESIHRTRPRMDMILRPFNHPDVYDEAHRRTNEIDRNMCY